MAERAGVRAGRDTPISLDAALSATVAGGDTASLVTRAVRRGGHCNFVSEEVLRGFADLTAWVDSGEPAAGEDLRGDLAGAGAGFTARFDTGDPLAP